MVDWFYVGANALWIVGAALALAGLSQASGAAAHEQATVRSRLALPGYQLVFYRAGLLVCAGIGATAPTVWQLALWMVLGLVFLFYTFQAWKEVGRPGRR